MGFINSPITNLDVSAVLGVRSKSVFTRTEPRPPPAQADARARPHRRGGGATAARRGLRAVTKLIFAGTKKAFQNQGLSANEGSFVHITCPRLSLSNTPNVGKGRIRTLC